MTGYRKNLLVWSCIMCLGLLSILAALYLSNWFLVLFALVVCTGHIFLKKITCPNCETPITYEGDGILFGVRIPTDFFRKKCANCGWDLDKDC